MPPSMPLLPSGACARQAREWLGMSSNEASDLTPAPMADAFTARPARLGLGAKFLSHAQAVALSPGEQKLQTQIKNAAAKRGAKEARQQGGAASSSTKQGKPAVDEDSEDSEDEGRTSKFSRKPQRPLPAGPAHRPAGPGVPKQAAPGVPAPLRGAIHKKEQQRR